MPVSIFEGPITSLSPAVLGPPELKKPETWNVMWIMGCPVHIHPDLILDGPTIGGEPIRGANLLDLLDKTSGRGHALKLLGATGKGVAERLLRPDKSGADEIYVMQEIVVELAENVIIYPDANDENAYFDEKTNTLKLFPNGVGGFQMKVKISEDANFPGHWLDAGGETLGDNSITALNNALANAPDKSLGLGGFFSISDQENDGIGEDTGTFYVVEGETTAPPAVLPAVLINRYNLRYDSNDNEARMEIRGQYVSDKPIEGRASVSLEMKHVDGVGAFPCTDGSGSDCLVPSALGSDLTGRPGKIARPLRRNRRNPIRRNRCNVNPDFSNTCNFRISLRENVEVLGLAEWPDYHSPLMLQYITDVFKIEVTARNSGTDTTTEATPGRIRVD